MNAQPAQPIAGQPVSPIPLPPSHHLIVDAAIMIYHRWRYLSCEQDALDKAVSFMLRAERSVRRSVAP